MQGDTFHDCQRRPPQTAAAGLFLLGQFTPQLSTKPKARLRALEHLQSALNFMRQHSGPGVKVWLQNLGWGLALAGVSSCYPTEQG